MAGRHFFTVQNWPKETIIEMERKIFYNGEAAKAGIWREYAAESGRTDRE